MRNIADVLTFFRFPAAISLFILILNEQWFAAMIVFIAAILSDAFDGIAARRWPPRERWYRKNPHDFDNAGDSLLFFAVMIGLTIQVYPLWLWVLIVSAVGSGVLLYLIKTRRPVIAEKIDVFFGWCFGALLFAMLVQITTLAVSEEVADGLTGAYMLAAAMIVMAKWDRVTSRPEVAYTGTR